MRRSFVSIYSPLLRAVGVSSHRATICSPLPSSSITRLHRYYEAIRLPVPHLPSYFFSCPAYSRYSERDAGPPGLPCNHSVKHAMVSDPEEAGIALPLAAMPVLTSTPNTVSSFLLRQFRGSIPSPFRITAYLLAVLRLKLTVASQPPRTRYPVDGLPSGAGFPPAGLHDLARPHIGRCPYLFLKPETRSRCSGEKRKGSTSRARESRSSSPSRSSKRWRNAALSRPIVLSI